MTFVQIDSSRKSDISLKIPVLLSAFATSFDLPSTINTMTWVISWVIVWREIVHAARLEPDVDHGYLVRWLLKTPCARTWRTSSFDIIN